MDFAAKPVHLRLKLLNVFAWLAMFESKRKCNVDSMCLRLFATVVVCDCVLCCVCNSVNTNDNNICLSTVISFLFTDTNLPDKLFFIEVTSGKVKSSMLGPLQTRSKMAPQITQVVPKGSTQTYGKRQKRPKASCYFIEILTVQTLFWMIPNNS